MSTVLDAWAALRAERRTESGWHVRRVYPSAACEMFAGLRQPGSVPGLLLEISTDDVPAGLSLPQSRGFNVEPAVLRSGSSGSVRFALTLTDPGYEAVFSVLCDDAAETAATAANARGGLRAWLGRLQVWQEFMSRHGAGGLSEEAALGLWGELWFMRERLVPLLGEAGAVDAWAGPRGEPNDFELRNGFIEIKSTSRQAPETIEISNIDQLDDARGTILLGHVLLHSHTEGETLLNLVADLRSRIGTAAPERMRRFSDLLLEVGYIDAAIESQMRPWRVRDVAMYRVAGDFPRLRRTELRGGVRECRYSIERAVCAGHTASEDVVAMLAGGAENG